MKKLLLLLLVVACCGVARAQAPARAQDPPPARAQKAARFHRWSIDLSGGAAFPIGGFAHTDEQNPKSGTVHTGSVFEASGTFHLSHTWGITLVANRQYNKSDVDNIIVPNPLFPEILVPGPLNPGGSYTSIPPQHWSMTRILAGGVYTLPLNHKKNLAVLVRALAGIEKAHVSQYEYFVHSQNSTGFSCSPTRNLAWAFAYQADAGLQYKVYRRWSVLAFAGYSGCRPSYNQDVTQLLQGVGQLAPGGPEQYKKIFFPTGSILVRAGAGFDF
jgi:hypothetical protein